MKKEYSSPLFEKFMPQTEEFCEGGTSGIISDDTDKGHAGNTGEADDMLD